ncbi:MAG: hypothetical protein ACHQKZ_04475 [Solirubrobacterales bacterium]|jgi:hypothetical protein
MNARRRFLSGLVAAPLVVAAEARSAPQAPSQPATPAAPPAVPPADPVADALAEVVKRRYGAQLEAADLEAIRKSLGEARQNAERMRTAVALGNADEPVTVFEARPRAGRERKGGRR